MDLTYDTSSYSTVYIYICISWREGRRWGENTRIVRTPCHYCSAKANGREGNEALKFSSSPRWCVRKRFLLDVQWRMLRKHSEGYTYIYKSVTSNLPRGAKLARIITYCTILSCDNRRIAEIARMGMGGGRLGDLWFVSKSSRSLSTKGGTRLYMHNDRYYEDH